MRDEEVSVLHERLAAAEQELSAATHGLEDMRSRFNAAQGAAAAYKRRYEQLSRRRVVRVALALARPMRPAFRAVRRIRGGRRADLRSRDVPASRPRTIHRRSRGDIVREVQSRGARGPLRGPTVSILILTRDGAGHLERLLSALDNTRYRSFEVVVVDNASKDGTGDVLAKQRSFPIRVLTNERNTSFSFGNNQAAQVANGEYLLFLNNDVEPISPDWLGLLVAGLDGRNDRVAAGAVLVYPDVGDPRKSFTVQHAGVEFGIREGAPYAFNVGKPDPLDPELVGTRNVAAATAAVLLVRRAAFESVGGFPSGYVYGTEDVDLCLRLSRLGEIVVVGDSVLFHHESASLVSERYDLIRVNRAGNWRLFVETWSPTLNRSLSRSRLEGNSRLRSQGRPVLAITLTQDDASQGYGDYYIAHELGDAFDGDGWDVIYAERHQDRWFELPDRVDLVISLLDSYDVRRAPSGAFTIAWVRDWVDRWMTQPWFNAFDLVTTASHRAADTIAGSTLYRPPMIPLATNPNRFAPGSAVPTFEADYAFTGNFWGFDRGLISMLDVQPGERFLAFGKGWESEPRLARYWRKHLDHELLPQLYRSVKVVLDDTATHTVPHALVNSRVFDALAAGSLVLTNNAEGSKELFDGVLPTYTTRAELRSQLDTYLGDDELRLKTVDALRSRVLDEYTYDRLPRRFLDAALATVDLPRVAFKIDVPREDLLETWGDTHVARAMGAALSEHGFVPEVHILPEWDRVDRQDCDVVVHLRGLTPYTPKPAHVNVLWVIRRPDDLSPGECDKYDLVLVASKPFAEDLAERANVPVVFMPPAADHRLFHPAEPETGRHEELLFVGNSGRQQRQGVVWAVDRRLPLGVYGGEWDGIIPSGYVKAEHVCNEQLPALYRSAKVVLIDHRPDMREHGFVSNRIFDVLACGGVVVSDPVAGLNDLFGDLVPIYETSDELDELARSLLGDPERRRAISASGPELVGAEHTFEHRARELARLLNSHLSGRAKNIEGETF